MKIKIITFFNNSNIGSELQAYAMKEYLNSVGYSDVTFIKRGHQGILRKGISFLIRKIRILFLNKDIKVLSAVKREYSQKHARISAETKKRISTFSIKNLKSEFCNIASLKKQSDCIYLCGSDQIWSPLIYPIVKENFLTPINRNRKIAYAPSFGVNQLPTSFKRRVSQFISDFDYIAMREKGAAEIVSEMCGREIETVVDPVFLVNEKCWHKLSNCSEIDISEPYVFCYFLDEPDAKNKKNLKEFIGNRKIVYICYKPYFIEFDNAVFYDVDPTDFLHLIKYSDMVITDSFHATAFSIIFEKNMKICSRNHPVELRQDGRIQNLLKGLDIPLEMDDFEGREDIIDYPAVKRKLFELSEEAKSFLLESLFKIDRSRD